MFYLSHVIETFELLKGKEWVRLQYFGDNDISSKQSRSNLLCCKTRRSILDSVLSDKRDED